MIIKALIIYAIASYILVPVLFFINEKYNLDFGIFWYCESNEDDKFTTFSNCWIISPITIIFFILQETTNIIGIIFEFLLVLVYDTIMNFCNKDEEI